MLFPKPPRPVGQRRAVAETIVAYQQAARIAVGHVFEVPTPAQAPAEAAPPCPDAPRPPLSQSGDDTPV